MNRSTMLKLIRKLCKFNSCKFLGIFPKDYFPTRITEYPSCLVANTDISSSQGLHWVVFYFHSAYRYEFFDSLGTVPLDYQFPIINSSFVYSKYSIQSSDSSICGHYCLVFLYLKLRGKSFRSIIHSFSSIDLDWNDQQISAVFKLR